MLPRPKRDLERGLRARALPDGFGCELKRRSIRDPAIDVVEMSVATEIVRTAQVVQALSERPMRRLFSAIRPGGPILSSRQLNRLSGSVFGTARVRVIFNRLIPEPPVRLHQSAVGCGGPI